MKIFLLSIALILSHIILAAQCPPGDLLIFSSQAQVDDFAISYPNCTEFDGDIVITGGDITNLYGLSALTAIGGNLSFLYNQALSNATGLTNLTAIEGDFIVNENYIMSSLIGLNNLSSIGGDLFIYKNNLLLSVSGLNGVTSIGAAVYIGYNAKVNNVTGLANLSNVEGAFHIEYCPLLGSLSGLENLASVGGDFSLQYLDILPGLEGLEGLATVGGNFEIRTNQMLASLEELYALTSIGGELAIRSNFDLISLDGIDNIDAASISDLEIYGNTSLSTCEVWSICNYLGSPNGNVSVTNNAPGCNSPEEIQDSCVANSVGVHEQANLDNISIYPNPARSDISIETTSDPGKDTKLTISNPGGQQLIAQHLTESKTNISIAKLPSGIYIVQIHSGQQTITRKLLVNK